MSSRDRSPTWLRHRVPLAPRTTFELGGEARYFAEVEDEDALLETVNWARENSIRTFVLGAGSNVVVGDAGFDGLVVRIRLPGLRFRPLGSGVVEVVAGAGEDWDSVVETCVLRGIAGVECLSGIPGLAGATPIQNVGAYGQEVSAAIHSVRAVHLDSLTTSHFSAPQCEFGYRDSRFKREADRWIVTAITLHLRNGGPPTVAYRQLVEALEGETNPTLGQVREAVLRLRASKSMLLDPLDPNRRSAGSFFTNPVVPEQEADRLVNLALAQGLVADGSEVPRFAAGPGLAKLAAAWLIENAGIPKGFRMGPVGVSSRHTLALVHHGGGSTRDLINLAAHVRRAVFERFGIELTPEPVLLGTSLPPL